ncbi:hypothetical protein MKZ38_005279 [Zalerion maritima]|uniref:Uncharacterized protein n=1 Tax=Zalerion maritima TaxID=339359 RepID=A0AAD5WQD1_9PEZI|nr:hypothetical protein MKZ38_005279 [Zalerion maritima]
MDFTIAPKCKPARMLWKFGKPGNMQDVVAQCRKHKSSTTAVGYAVRKSMLDDENISSIGKYPYETQHVFLDGEGKEDTLKVHTCILNSPAPTLAWPSCTFLSRLREINYGSMHKLEESSGQKVIDMFVSVVENVNIVGRT